MDSINDDIINILRNNTSSKENTIDLLRSIIPIGKEAAYRRLRGKIPFTLDEAVAICKALNISLDLLIGTKQEDTYAFHLNAIFAKDPIPEYIRMLYSILDGVKYILGKEEDSCSYRAYRSLPSEFLYKYESLSKVYIYVLFYQLYIFATPEGVSAERIPEDVFTTQKELSEIMQEIDSVLIVDKGMFIEYIEIVKYFKELGILSEQDGIQIKQDLHSMLTDMERCAVTGITPRGKKMDIYVSGISFDCTYTYIECGDYSACSVGTYCLDHLTCQTPIITQNHKLWIKSLIRFSTLISVSGELQRSEFFNKQRKYIDTLI